MSGDILHKQLRRTPKKLAAHAPEHSKTLMRSPLKKPELSFKRQIHVHSPLVSTSSTITVKHGVLSIPPDRLEHATMIAKADSIAHFTDTTTVHSRPAMPAPEPVQKPLLPAQPSMDIFERALAQASTQLPPKLPKPKNYRRQLLMSLPVLGCLVFVAALLLVKSYPALQLETSSHLAGFQASVPNVTAAGFIAGNVTASAGQIAIPYINTASQTGYSVIEQRSSWSTTDLEEQYVDYVSGGHFTIASVSGRPVFLYGTADATWLDKGYWYRLESTTTLSNYQILAIASSL